MKEHVGGCRHGDEAALILFDWDGTLVDSHALIVRAMQQSFLDCGLQAPSAAAVQSVIGLSLSIAVGRLTVATHLQAQVVSAFRVHYRTGEDVLQLYPGVRDTLDELRQRGYWLGIVTGKSKSGLMRALDLFALNDYFYVIRTADCTHSKPHPAMVLECMDELGV